VDDIEQFNFLPAIDLTGPFRLTGRAWTASFLKPLFISTVMPISDSSDNPEARLREMAWIGDAVLALWAREWLLKRDGKMQAELFIRLTSNQFLACFGNPTAVEARFGEIYVKDGLAEAFVVMERELVPLFERQELKRDRQRRRV
jgi:hypothetical protein